MSGPTPSAALDALPLGSRVVVRHLIEGGERATDALGELVARGPGSLVVRTRTTEVSIARDDVVAAKPVPERPWRLAAFLRRAGVAVLDLDGVIRGFDEAGHRAVSGAELGLAPMGLVDLVDELTAAGTPTFVFTNGTDQVPAELEQIGLGRLIPLLLDAHDLGFAKPAPEAYAVAHAEIERRLGRTVGRAEVRFTDDRAADVDAAREFGWHGQLFTLPRP